MKTVRLIFIQKELLYDIANAAWIQGDVMPTEDEHQRHTVIDITQDGNRDRVVRMLNLYFANVVELLYQYTRHEAVDESQQNDQLIFPRKYIIRLSLPDDFSNTSVHYLKELIHNYIVCRVLYDYLSITYPEAAQNWHDKAQRLQEDIKSTTSHRVSYLKRKLNPW